jgi:hypothetical protein
MKKFLYLVGFTLVCFMVACDRQLDLAPENTLVDSEVFSSASGAEQALAEAYYDLLLAIMNNDAYLFGDFTTPALLHAVSYDMYDQGLASPSDSRVVGIWTAYYKAINAANNVIAKVPAYGNYDTAIKAQYIAESKFIRAYAYLDLLKFYGDGALTGNLEGLGLPLQLTPYEGYTTGQVVARSSNGEVYDQIILDLNSGLASLPDRQDDDLSTRSRATKGSANALLARAYLYMRQYDAAAVAGKKVIDRSDVYTLSADLLQLFPPDPNGTAQTMSAEYVFGLPVSQAVSSSSSISYGPGYSYYYKLNFWISPSFIAGFESGDKRVSQLMYKGDTVYNYRPAYLTTYKFNNAVGRDNIPLIRLAEVYLTRAEALVRSQGVNAESVSLLNSIRSRSIPGAVPYSTSDFTNSDALTDSILHQRDCELAFEGQYRTDLIRTGRALHDPDLVPGRKVLPIPQSEIDISKGLIKQNTGY